MNTPNPEITILGISINAGGLPKTPQLEGPVRLTKLGFEGDQHRYKGHGGPDKAVCVYTEADYLALEAAGVKPPDGEEFNVGAFGENLTLENLNAGDVRLGDIFLCGDIALQISEPRQPCANLDVYGKALKEIMRAECRTGFYMRVLNIGDALLAPGMTFKRTNCYGPRMRDLWKWFYVDLTSAEAGVRQTALDKILSQESASASFKLDAQKRAKKHSGA